MKFVFLLFTLIVSSCLGGDHYYERRIQPFLKKLEKNYKPQKFDGVVEPNFPDLEENMKTLQGIDSNKDGVRDDLEIFINRNFHTWIERESLKNEIRGSLNFYLNYKTMSLDEFIIYQSNRSVEFSCIFYGLKTLNLQSSPELSSYNNVEAIYNTKQRELAYFYKEKELSGRAYGEAYGDKEIFEKCKLQIDSKRR